MPHTDALPIELYSPYIHQMCIIINYKRVLINYVGVIRTLNNKYQKFMTYRLVYNIYILFNMNSKSKVDPT